ncbi:MAG: hypothetical protein Q9160_008224 [Pyrenula sp. 1 TL-2023]
MAESSGGAEHAQKLDAFAWRENFAQCMKYYENMFGALGSSECYVAREGLVDRLQISDQYSRMKVWGDQITDQLESAVESYGAPGQSSADWYENDMQLLFPGKLGKVILAAIQRMKSLLLKALLVAKVTAYDADDSDTELIDSTSDDSETEASRPAKAGSHRAPRIIILMRHISAEIETLYDASSILRRHTVIYEASSRQRHGKSTSEYSPSKTEPDPDTEGYYPNLSSTPAIRWPTEQNLRQKDNIYYSNNDPDFRINRLHVEMATWRPLLKQFFEISLTERMFQRAQVHELQRVVSRRILAPADAIKRAKVQETDRLQKLRTEARAMLAELGELARASP